MNVLEGHVFWHDLQNGNMTLLPKGNKMEQGERHILVVDDDEVVRGLSKKFLTALGYQVSSAGDGLEGVIIFYRKMENISLVLLDIVMPKMDGLAAFKRMRELNPEIPILLCSGFSPPDTLDELLEQGKTGFLPKPYSLKQLSTKVSQLIS